MKRSLLLFITLLVLALAACAGQPQTEQPITKSDGPLVTVYRAPP